MNDQTITDYWRLELLGANDHFRRRYRRRAVIRAGLWLTVALAVVVVVGRLTATHPAFLIAEGVSFIIVWCTSGGSIESGATLHCRRPRIKMGASQIMWLK